MLLIMEDDSGLAVLGVIFGIILLVVWIFTTGKNVWQGESYCKNCGGWVSPTAIKCVHCGSEFEGENHGSEMKFTTLSPERNFNATKEALNEVINRKIYCINCEVSLGIYGNQKRIDCWNCKATNLV